MSTKTTFEKALERAQAKQAKAQENLHAAKVKADAKFDENLKKWRAKYEARLEQTMVKKLARVAWATNVVAAAQQHVDIDRAASKL